MGNVLTWVRRYRRWAPVTRIEVEQVKFDMQLMQNPEVSGIEYQRGELSGWEVRAYLLEKFQHKCVYCSKGNTTFELDHQVPRSRGGSDRVSNLCNIRLFQYNAYLPSKPLQICKISDKLSS
jgi:5-methylcytosine-specific restriction endonuclease McrA